MIKRLVDSVSERCLCLWFVLVKRTASVAQTSEIGRPTETTGSLDTGIIEILRRALQRYPRWRSGHMYLARYALEASHFELVQGSILAAQALGADRDRSQGPQLEALRGTLALRLGYPDRAVQVLSSALKSRPKDSALKEELAAAYAALGEKQKAIEMLRSVPIDALSPNSRVALEMLSDSMRP